MAVVRPELEIEEVEALLDMIGKPERASVIYRARRELARQLERAYEVREAEHANMARIRAKRRVPGDGDRPLIPQSVSRFAR